MSRHTDELFVFSTGTLSRDADAHTFDQSQWESSFSSGTGLLPFFITYLTACIVFFGELGRFPLFNPDEALYAEPAREMLEMGQYITTLLNYVVRYTKPPLTIWAQALGIQLFGVNEFAVRFCSASSAVVLVAATYIFAERYVGRKAALFASFALMTAPLFVSSGREAITDVPLSLFIAGSLMAFYHAFAQKNQFWNCTGYVLVGLAVMTKGPVGAILPLAIMSVYHLLRGQLKESIKFYKPHLGALIVGAISIPWFATEITVTKGEYFREFIMRENFQRFTGVVDHKAPWWYHIAAMFGGFFPWAVFLPTAMWNAMGAPKLKVSNVTESAINALRTLKSLKGGDAVALFCLVTALLTLGFFSVSVSKLLPYTLPAFPFIAVLVGWQMQRWFQSGANKPVVIGLSVLSAGYGVAFLVLPMAVQHLRDCPADLLTLIPQILSVEFVAALLALLVSWRGGTPVAVAGFALITLLSTVGFGSRLLDICANEWEVPVRDFAQYAAVSKTPIVVLGMRKPSVPFYAHRRVLVPKDKSEMDELLPRLDDAYVIAGKKDEKYLLSFAGSRIIQRQGRFVLVLKQKPSGEKASTAAP